MRFRNTFLLFISVAAAQMTLPIGAQTLVSGYFLEGNLQRSMLNPAFAGDHNYIAFPLLGNLSVGIKGNVGMSNFLYPYQRDGYALTTFMSGTVDADEFLRRLPDVSRLSVNADATLLAAGFRSFGGYSTLRVSLRSEAGVAVPKDFFVFAKKGLQNNHYSLSGLQMNALVYSDIALGHSHTLGDRLSIGATAHLLFGGGAADVVLRTFELDLDETAWRAKSEVTGQLATFGKTTVEYHEGDDIPGIDVRPGLTSFGLAADMGAAYDLEDVVSGLRVSAALTDMGFLNWSSALDVRTKEATFEYSGIGEIDPENYSFEEEVNQIAEDVSDMFKMDFVEGHGFKTTLSPLLSVGAEYEFPFCRKLSAALLLRKRFGQMTGYTDARVYVNAAPLKWLDLSVNVGVSTYGTEMGWMVNIHPRVLSFFIGSDCMAFRVTPQYIPVNHCNTHVCMGVNIPF